MRTLLALVAATAMIAAALYVRGGGGGDGAVGDLVTPDEPPSLVCVSELRAVCDALAEHDVEITVEEAGVTAAALAGGSDTAHDAWLTLAPWPQIVAEAQQRASLPQVVGEPTAAVARSPLVMVVAAERGAVLAEACRGGLTWRCVGANADEPWAAIGGAETWGNLKVGFRDPVSSGPGLLVLGSAATSFLDTSDFSTRELNSDEFRAWLSRLAAGVPNHGAEDNTPLQQQVRLPAAFDVVGTTEAEAAPLLEGPRAATLSMRYPEPVVVAEVVLAPLGDGDGADRLRELVEESGKAALATAGWRVEGQPRAAGVPDEPALPESPTTPNPGVLDALRSRWQEVAQ